MFYVNVICQENEMWKNYDAVFSMFKQLFKKLCSFVNIGLSHLQFNIDVGCSFVVCF